MHKKSKETNVNLYYMNSTKTNQKKDEKKVIKERENRIKQKNKEKQKDDFETDTDIVIGMTNKNNKRKAEENKKIIAQKQKKINKKKKKIKRIIKWTTLILIIVGGIIFALTSPIFNIKEIEVVGNNQISTQTILSLSQLNTEQNIFKFQKKQIERNIKEHAYIENVKVERKIPNKVKIQVDERTKKFEIELLNRYAYINSQGYILEISNEKQEMPILQGIKTKEEDITVGNRLGVEDLNKLEIAIKIIDACNNNNLEGKVTSIDISDKNDYSIYIIEELKKVHLGDGSNLSNKMLYVQKIIEKEKGKEGEIFVNGDLNNKFNPYFREKV